MHEQQASTRNQQPDATRPRIERYGIPKDIEGLLPWSWAEERLRNSLNYWVATTRPDRRPHAAPVWGAWIEGAFYFEGGSHTRRGRNIAANPAVVIHIESGDDIVIVEGTAEEMARPDAQLVERLIGAFAQKYGPKYGSGLTLTTGRRAVCTSCVHTRCSRGVTSQAMPLAGSSERISLCRATRGRITQARSAFHAIGRAPVPIGREREQSPVPAGDGGHQRLLPMAEFDSARPLIKLWHSLRMNCSWPGQCLLSM